MREIIGIAKQWKDAGKDVALATVIKTWGSSPRKAGAHMAINSEGDFTGSVSGGCIEGVVIEEALSTKLLHFGVADDMAWEVGLACGGEIDVFIQPFNSDIVNKVFTLIDKDAPFTYSFVIEGHDSSLGKLNIQEGVIQGVDPQIVTEETPEGNVKKFFSSVQPSPSLLIVGGVHITIKLAQIAKLMGYKIFVIDPRKAFMKTDRFPEIDDLISTWPDEAFKSLPLNSSSAVVTLSHDPKIDDPSLLAALNSPAFYIGALGSKKTNRERRARLKEAGCSDTQLKRIYSPVGIDIGSRTPDEIALAIMAEIIAVKNGLL
jgi:xanthine dehydrogenase accessory factor